MAKISFAWDASPSPGDIRYKMYEKAPGSDDFVQIVDGIEVLFFDLLMDGYSEGEYSYYATAYNDFGESAPSNIVTVNFIIPVAPSGLGFTIGS